MKDHRLPPLLATAWRAAGLAVRDEVLHPPARIDRRTLLELMAASSALALGAGCDRKPPRKIVSMHDAPEYLHPGQPLHYATTWTDGPVPYGLMVRNLDGRPVKVEGLPEHPLNRGTATAAMQAALMSLYDPDRLRAPRRGEAEIGWDEVDRIVVEALRAARKVVLLTRAMLGPAERALVARFVAACRGAVHLVHETVHDGARRLAWRVAYGADGELRPRYDRARVVLSVDCDFLGTDGDVLGATAGWAARRSPATVAATEELSRLWIAEAGLSVTGANADHHLSLLPSAALGLVGALRAALGGDGAALGRWADAEHVERRVLDTLAADLRDHRGEAVVVAGAHLPASVHAAVCLLNDELGAAGTTLEWCSAPATLPPDDPAKIARAMESGVDVLVTLGVNPVYDFPGGEGAALVAKARLAVGHGLHRDETLHACHLALPSHHGLESWNDALLGAGSYGLCQPVITPLFASRQEAESLLAWTKALAPGDPELQAAADWPAWLRRHWARNVLAGEPDTAWDDALRRGFHGMRQAEAFPALNRKGAEAWAGRAPSARGEHELVLLPHHAVFDGRFAANGWLQELPEPITKLVWDNAAVLAPATAAALGVEDEDWISVRSGDRAVNLPVLVLPGVAAGVVVTTLGHGRTAAGTIGTERGVNVAPLLPETPRMGERIVTRVDVQRTSGPNHTFARTQKTFSMEGRPIVLRGTRQEYEANPHFPAARTHSTPDSQLHPDWDYSTGHKWVMAIDLSRCTGCSACVVACNAENNIPIVGKDECTNGREMHWMRLDTYYGGDAEHPEVHSQPMLCQHCDNAPCETVCPFNATAHSPEGLNEQVYNRCAGTRYCANNCPYKVRRFNFFDYPKLATTDPVQELAYNPQVTVRMRGVMEKCTFCVQRIHEAKFRAADADRPVADGDVRPACQQTCPAAAIVFGDGNDPASRVAALARSPLAYHVLGELNVRPNVNYLARIVNPHPALSAPPGAGAEGGGDR
ncbi:MAG: 4Fe-4S dicluster domain-containing protein [Planctomycetota bacterium]